AIDSTGVSPPAISFTNDFKIAWLAPEGSAIAAGDPIVKFDTTELERALQASRTEVEAASKRLDKRRQEVVLQRGNDAVHVLEADAAARKAALKRQAPPELTSSIEVREHVLDDELAQMA